MGVEMRDDTNSDGRLCLAVPGSLSIGFGCVGTAKAVCIWRAATENQALRSGYTPTLRKQALCQDTSRPCERAERRLAEKTMQGEGCAHSACGLYLEGAFPSSRM